MWSLAQLLCLFMGFPAVFWKLEIKDIFKNLPSRLGNGTTGIPRVLPSGEHLSFAAQSSAAPLKSCYFGLGCH